MLSHNFFKQIDGRNILLDISCNSDSVQGTITYVENGEKVKVLSRVSQDFAVTSTGEKDLVKNQTINALDALCKKIAQESEKIYELDDLFDEHQKIHQVTLHLSSPWVHKQVLSKEWIYPNTQKVDIDQLVKEIELPIPQGYSRLDTTVASVTANGYQIAWQHLQGKNISQCKLSLIDSFVSFDDLETLFQVVSTNLNITVDQCTARSHFSSLMGYIQQQHKPQGDYVVVHMHGNMSDILAFSGSGAQEHVVLPVGLETFTSALIESGIAPSYKQACSMLKLHEYGHLHSDQKEKISIALKKVVEKIGQAISDKSQRDNQMAYFFHEGYFSDAVVSLIDEALPDIQLIDVNIPSSEILTGIQSILLGDFDNTIHFIR